MQNLIRSFFLALFASIAFGQSTVTYIPGQPIDLSGTSYVRVANGAGASTTTAGALIYDTTNKNLHAGGNGVDNFVGLIPSGSVPSNGNCTQFSVVGNVVTLADAGAPCGTAGANPTITLTNAAVTGTTLHTLTKLGTLGTALIATAGDTGGVVGITTAGAGTVGTATITTAGKITCVFDGATTANDYVQISSGTAGDCTDTGAATYPTSGQVIGRVLSTNIGAGTYTIDLFPSEIKAATGSGLADPGANGIVQRTALNTTAPATSHNLSAPLLCADSSGSGTVQSCTTSPTFVAAAGDTIIYTTTTANTGALTIAVNGGAAAAVNKWGGSAALVSGDITANKPFKMVFDAAGHWDVDDIGNAPTGGGGIALTAPVNANWTAFNTGSDVVVPSCASLSRCEWASAALGSKSATGVATPLPTPPYTATFRIWPSWNKTASNFAGIGWADGTVGTPGKLVVCGAFTPGSNGFPVMHCENDNSPTSFNGTINPVTGYTDGTNYQLCIGPYWGQLIDDNTNWTVQYSCDYNGVSGGAWTIYMKEARNTFATATQLIVFSDPNSSSATVHVIFDSYTP